MGGGSPRGLSFHIKASFMYLYGRGPTIRERKGGPRGGYGPYPPPHGPRVGWDTQKTKNPHKPKKSPKLRGDLPGNAETTSLTPSLTPQTPLLTTPSLSTVKPPLNTTLTGRISASQEISQPSSPIPSLNLPSWLQGYLEFGWANGHFANILENNNTVQHQVKKESTAAVVRSPGQQEGHEAPAGPPEEQHDGNTAELGRGPPAKGDLEAPAAELDPPPPPPPSGAETPAATPPPHTPSGEQPIAATPAASPSPPTPPPAAPPSPCSPSQQEREKAGTQPGNCVRT